ncbi:hypothetical protein L9F63_020720, partial [Diploptera punctata]
MQKYMLFYMLENLFFPDPLLNISCALFLPKKNKYLKPMVHSSMFMGTLLLYLRKYSTTFYPRNLLPRATNDPFFELDVFSFNTIIHKFWILIIIIKKSLYSNII